MSLSPATTWGGIYFFAQKCPFFSFSIVVIFEKNFSDFGPFRAFSLPTNWGDKYFLRIMALSGHFRCLLLRGDILNFFKETYIFAILTAYYLEEKCKNINFLVSMLIFFAFSPATNWGNIFFWYASVDLIFLQGLREESFKIVFRLIFCT